MLEFPTQQLSPDVASRPHGTRAYDSASLTINQPHLATVTRSTPPTFHRATHTMHGKYRQPFCLPNHLLDERHFGRGGDVM